MAFARRPACRRGRQLERLGAWAWARRRVLRRAAGKPLLLSRARLLLPADSRGGTAADSLHRAQSRAGAVRILVLVSGFPSLLSAGAKLPDAVAAGTGNAS